MPAAASDLSATVQCAVGGPSRNAAAPWVTRAALCCAALWPAKTAASTARVSQRLWDDSCSRQWLYFDDSSLGGGGRESEWHERCIVDG